MVVIREGGRLGDHMSTQMFTLSHAVRDTLKSLITIAINQISGRCGGGSKKKRDVVPLPPWKKGWHCGTNNPLIHNGFSILM